MSKAVSSSVLSFSSLVSSFLALDDLPLTSISSFFQGNPLLVLLVERRYSTLIGKLMLKELTKKMNRCHLSK